MSAKTRTAVGAVIGAVGIPAYMYVYHNLGAPDLSLAWAMATGGGAVLGAALGYMSNMDPDATEVQHPVSENMHS